MERIIPTLPQNILMTTITYSAQTNPIPMASMSVDKVLSNSRFPVYLTNSTDKKYVLKVFPFDGEEPSEYYRTEALIAKLNHPNIVRIPQTIDEKLSIKNGRVQKISMILMEYEPNGDLHDLIANHRFPLDDKLARTYFQQLVHALEFLHSNGIAHLDLKLENLLLGEGYLLKIADFDACQFINKGGSSPRKGTMNFRAPEVKSGRVLYPTSADVYSAGVILFALKSGMLPYREDKTINNYDMYKLLQSDVNAFWDAHNDCRDQPVEYDKNFKKLFFSMVRADPEKRITIEEIKKSEWYNGPVYTQKELIYVMNKKLKGLPSILQKKN